MGTAHAVFSAALLVSRLSGDIGGHLGNADSEFSANTSTCGGKFSSSKDNITSPGQAANSHDGASTATSALLVYWGTLPRSMLTLFKVLCGGVDWEECRHH